MEAEDDFYESGGDSVILFKIITELEEKYSVKIDVNCMMDFETISEMANYVDELKSSIT